MVAHLEVFPFFGNTLRVMIFNESVLNHAAKPLCVLFVDSKELMPSPPANGELPRFRTTAAPVAEFGRLGNIVGYSKQSQQARLGAVYVNGRLFRVPVTFEAIRHQADQGQRSLSPRMANRTCDTVRF